MNVAVINLPGYNKARDRFCIKAGSRWSFAVEPLPSPVKPLAYCPYPFMLSYTAQLIRRETDHRVLLLDGVAERLTWEETLDRLDQFSPDYIVTELVTVSYDDDIAFLRKARARFGCRIVAGGSHATVMWKEILEQCRWLGAVCVGEYEFTVLDIVKGKVLGEVEGVAFISGRGPQKNPRRSLCDLNRLPFADRESLREEWYRDFCFRRPFAIMMATRGCPMSCSFCIERHILYASSQYRTRDVGNVVDEMEMLREKYGVRQVYFDDMTFTVSRKYVNAICEEIKKRDCQMYWSCMGDLFSGMNYDTLRNMRDSGCVGMKFGLETINESLIQGVGKKLRLAAIREKIAWLHRLGIFSHATIMFGLPGDSLESMHRTVDFAHEMDIDSVQYSIATPFPGTPFFEAAKARQWLRNEGWQGFSGHGMCVLDYPDMKHRDIENLYNSYQKNGAGRRWGGKKRLKMKTRKLLHPSYILRECRKMIRVFGLLNFIGVFVGYLCLPGEPGKSKRNSDE